MNVHRVRFVDYTPPAITSIAFSHRSNPGDHHSQNLRCAVGRANGDIEIWNPRDNWTLDITLKGGQGRSIEGLSWVTQKGHGPRLLSIGSSTMVTEWSLDVLQPKASLDCNAGAIWSIAVSPDQESVALGCEDGSLVIADVSGGPGVLTYKHVLTRQKSRILSLAFSGQDIIVGGCSDSTVKVWDCRQARGPILARMAVDRVRNEPTLVWSVLVLKNGTIVSGDSTGSVKMWDKKFYSLLQNFKLHQADVLCLGTNASGDTLFSAGVDRKMQMYQLVDNKRKWAHISGRRFHAHDVRAMASYESRGMSSIVTGGVDMSLAIIPLQEAMKINHRMIPAVTQRASCSVARNARLLLMCADRQIKIWRLCQSYEMDLEPSQQLVSRMTFQNEENLTSAAINQQGTYLVVSSLVETKMYVLLASETSEAIKPVKIVNEDLAAQGARMVYFCEDGKKFFLVTPESNVRVYDVGQSDVDEDDGMYDVELKERCVVDMNATVDDSKKNQTYLKSINHVSSTRDGSVFAVSNQSNVVKIFESSSGQLLTVLPAVASSITAMSFRKDQTLVLTTASMQIHEFDIKTGRLTPWSNKNTPLVPGRFTRLQDHCTKIFVDNADRLWMSGASWLSYIEMASDLPPDQIQAKRKRKNASTDNVTQVGDGFGQNGNSNVDHDIVLPREKQYQDQLLRGKFWITFKYRSMLLFDVLNDKELLVVERPATDMVNSGDIPPPFYVKRYGQS